MAVPSVLAAPAAAHIAVQSAATTGLTSGRLVGTTAAFVALAGVVIGVLALTRSTDRPGNGSNGNGSGSGNGTRRNRAIMALAAALVGLVMGVVNLAVADGGPGTGNGVIAGAAALALGLIGTALGGLAVTRARRTG
ncbi:DUF6223 family protein [Streptomyces ossamyceticus]|uniref:DUF6223 family protein n=1 Tax=Streptomyces ossamyceticus TaxID=249581 RepID=A0ABV2V7N5_9ACTN